jgi:zinc transport system ATP-binding protein
MALISLENISLKLNNHIILDKISLDIKQEKITTIIGPNGGGKTSLLKIILHLIKPTSGKIKQQKKVNFGYMPQKINLDCNIPMSALDLINLTNKNTDKDSFFLDLAKQMQVLNLLKKQLSQLSGGQLQKIMLLRTIASQINIANKQQTMLVLDEPTQFMDIMAMNQFYHLLNYIKNTWKCSILLVSHDLNLVMHKTDQVFCINQHVCCYGSPQDIGKNQEYLNLFGNDLVKKNLEIALYKHSHNHDH